MKQLLDWTRKAELTGAVSVEPVVVDCPWCGESVELLIDLSGGDSQDYVEDCEVCCRPWNISVVLGPAGDISVTAEPSD